MISTRALPAQVRCDVLSLVGTTRGVDGEEQPSGGLVAWNLVGPWSNVVVPFEMPYNRTKPVSILSLQTRQ